METLTSRGSPEAGQRSWSAADSHWTGPCARRRLPARSPVGETLPSRSTLCRLRRMRKTTALVQVAAAMLEDPDDQHYGYQTSKKSGIRSGVLYPILSRMLEEGWVMDGWEDPTTIEGRPPRRYYEITELGKARMGALLAEARAEQRFAFIFKPGLAR